MIHFPKTPRPDIVDLLNKEAIKANGNYNLDIVQDQLDIDFHKKCYLCEDGELTNIQTEHLVPHKGDTALKYSWDNLFNSCPHCNNTKLDGFSPILDCTKADVLVEEQIEISLKPFPKIQIITTAHPVPGHEIACQNTIDLLNDIFHGRTTQKIREAKNLRQKMLKQWASLLQVLEQSPIDEEKVLPFLCSSAPFAGLQRWLVRKEWPHVWNNLVDRL